MATIAAAIDLLVTVITAAVIRGRCEGDHLNKALAGAGVLAATAGVLVSGCSSATQETSSRPAVSSSASVTASANADSGDCMFGVFGADVEVGIANPTRSCSSWIRNLAGKGLAWYPINQLAKLGSQDSADSDTMAETCDLTDGTQELFVEDGGEMPYGAGTCTREEQDGWTPEATPGPLASQSQQAQPAAEASGQASGAAAEHQAQS
jgi:hypothetical protein